jgi:hypothetical protein
VPEWHLRELEAQLAKRGWQVVGVHDGDEHRVSTSWEIERGKQHLFLDFQGLDDMITLPLEQAYGVEVRGNTEVGLYFSKKATHSRPNRSWEQDLAGFVAALEDVDP